MSTKPGVRSVSASALTGTVLILFDPDKPIDEIIALLEEVAESASHSKDRMPAPHPRSETRDFSLPSLPAIWNDLKSFVGRAARQGNFISSALRGPSPPRGDQSESSKEQRQQEWHLVEADDVITFWQSSRTGLDGRQVESRLREYGYNVLPQAEPRSTLAIFLGQFRSLPVVLLIGSSVLSALTGGVVDAFVILGVVILNAGIGALTERKSERTITSLLDARQPAALVVRDNRVQEIKGEEVVVGDLLVLTRGAYVAADARLIEVERLTVDESALTGESVPATKNVRRLDSALLPLGDRVNMVYRGTVVTGGSGLAVVVATGGGAEIGRIQSLIASTYQPETTMQRQMRGLGNQLIGVAGAACGLMFVVGLLRGYGLLEMLQSSIALAVAAIPEGLPVVATTTLAYGVKNMRERNVLVRRLEAVESLGAVQVMCLDKTGTITMNRMSVVSAVATGVLFIAVRFDSTAIVDIQNIARQIVREAGYDDDDFNARTCTIMTNIMETRGDRRTQKPGGGEEDIERLVVSDQCMVFGFACAHNATLMPHPIYLAHKLARRMEIVRREGIVPHLAPEAKAQVGMEYRNRRPHRIYSINLIASQKMARAPSLKELREDLMRHVIGAAFSNEEIRPDSTTRIDINAEGVFLKGGPAVHSGLTGRKSGDDTYGDYARHTGMALS